MFIGKVKSHSINSKFSIYNHVFEVATFLLNTRNLNFQSLCLIVTLFFSMPLQCTLLFLKFFFKMYNGSCTYRLPLHLRPLCFVVCYFTFHCSRTILSTYLLYFLHFCYMNNVFKVLVRSPSCALCINRFLICSLHALPFYWFSNFFVFLFFSFSDHFFFFLYFSFALLFCFSSLDFSFSFILNLFFFLFHVILYSYSLIFCSSIYLCLELYPLILFYYLLFLMYYKSQLLYLV